MAVESDYFNVNRRLLKSDLWLTEPFTRGQAWVDLIGLANWKSGFVRIRGVQLDLKRGELAASDAWLAERWKWSRGKCRRFLKELENGQRIIQQKNNVCTLVAIVNYDSYQSNGTADSTPNGTADGQQTGQQTDTQEEGITRNKNEKKVKTDAANAPELVGWLTWWNSLYREQLVPCGVEVDPPSQAAKAGWKRLTKDRELRELLVNRDAIEREIRASPFCREGWFRFEKLFAKNRDGEYIVRKLIDKGYRTKGGAQKLLTGSIHNEHAAATDPDHGKW